MGSSSGLGGSGLHPLPPAPGIPRGFPWAARPRVPKPQRLAERRTRHAGPEPRRRSHRPSAIVLSIVRERHRPGAGLTYGDATYAGGWLAAIAGLALLLPNLAVGVRRLHDTGRTGWWLLIGLVPFVGVIVLLYFFILDSENDNQYGPYPKD